MLQFSAFRVCAAAFQQPIQESFSAISNALCATVLLKVWEWQRSQGPNMHSTATDPSDLDGDVLDTAHQLLCLRF